MINHESAYSRSVLITCKVISDELFKKYQHVGIGEGVVFFTFMLLYVGDCKLFRSTTKGGIVFIIYGRLVNDVRVIAEGGKGNYIF